MGIQNQTSYINFPFQWVKIECSLSFTNFNERIKKFKKHRQISKIHGMPKDSQMIRQFFWKSKMLLWIKLKCKTVAWELTKDQPYMKHWHKNQKPHLYVSVTVKRCTFKNKDKVSTSFSLFNAKQKRTQRFMFLISTAITL